MSAPLSHRTTRALIGTSLALGALTGAMAHAGPAAAAGSVNGKILYTGHDTIDGEIYSINPDGTGKVNLTKHEASDNNGQWSPDGKKIAFESDRDNNRDIYVMNADGSGPKNLTQDHYWDYNPTWSPDGKRIAFSSLRDYADEGAIYVMNADGSGERRLASGAQPAWSPDGTKIAFLDDRDGNGEIYVMSVPTTTPSISWLANSYEAPATRLTNHSNWDGDPEWSPDGTKLAFATDRWGQRTVALMNPDGTNPTRVTPLLKDAVNGPSQPAFSPDGKMITYAATKSTSQIYIINTNGTSPGGGTDVLSAGGTGGPIRITTGYRHNQSPEWQKTPTLGLSMG